MFKNILKYFCNSLLFGVEKNCSFELYDYSFFYFEGCNNENNFEDKFYDVCLYIEENFLKLKKENFRNFVEKDDIRIIIKFLKIEKSVIVSKLLFEESYLY